ncbi:MAG: hypothetical protein EWV52_20580 [Microcystis panniformis Mp_MB_F_20051200_S6D]|nr:MAG: hypothetical protein EWV43_22260 [Microcystis panniformis Mp_MB_F_20080800_S26D]TRV45141.1 MAG: hypothetical protein EWV87_18015 [Microcystis panniformis Mp_GB_SS_20050300_S99]TRV52795.1 MAG: hypothetical protein EWV42_07360 [Microcystis panniformis Mp_GB_SS_20050300_S99D]TRV56590.1 MAG: hypothetical protein EWV69_17650 [Microcystis panniformis Mp_MB_F_20080800_S26]TRV66138.1 MAG: hypothetical protein EWV86_07575 [Microcystis panniformis Mp_MB_F_20051200_S9D]TRV68586.1 MAG: hypothetica
MIDLCVLCVFVVRSTPSLGGMYLRIHFTHQIQENPLGEVIINIEEAVVKKQLLCFLKDE